VCSRLPASIHTPFVGASSVKERRHDDRSGGVKVRLALSYTDMRKGFDGLAMLVQQTLK